MDRVHGNLSLLGVVIVQRAGEMVKLNGRPISLGDYLLEGATPSTPLHAIPPL